MLGMDEQPLVTIASALEAAVGDEFSWRDRAACRGLDPNIFFPAEGDYVGVERAKHICSPCPVAWECLSYAVETNQTEGVWGGTSRGQRRRLRRILVRQLRETG